MKDKIILLDGSQRLHRDVPLEAIAEIARLRPLDVEHYECPEFIKHFTDKSFERGRNQLNAYEFTNALHQTQAMRDRYGAGKLIIVDEDAYSGDADCNWFFGALSKCPDSLGYILVSTARMKNLIHAKDIIRHEIGHMFGAPSEDRANTYELCGTHCSNDYCVMQQKVSVAESVRYAEQRSKLNSSTYCSQCERDIREKR